MAHSPSIPEREQEKIDVVDNHPVPPMPAHVQRAGRSIILALLVIAPLLFLQPDAILQNPLDSLRRIVLLFGAGLLAALTVYSWSLRGRLVLRWHALDGGVLLFLLALVVSSLGGAYPHISLLGPVWMNDGLQLLGGFVLLYFGIKEFLREPADRALAAFLLVAMGGAVAAIGLVERFVFDPQVMPHLPKWVAALKFNRHFSGTRLLSTLGNPMFTGTYLAMLIPLAAGVALAAASRLRLLVALVSLEVMLFALFFTLARAAWVGLAVALPLLLAVVLWRAFASTVRRQDAPNPHFRPALLALAALLVVNIILGGVVVSVTPGLRDRFRSLSDMRKDGTVQTRAVYMQTSWEMFKARPIQGWGPGNLRYVFPQYRPYSVIKESTLPLNRGYNTALPHNLFLQTAAEMGVIGLFAFLLLLVLGYRAGFRLLRAPAETSWTAIGLLGMVTVYLLVNQMAFDNSLTMVTFWFGLALLAGFTATDSTLSSHYGRLAASLSPRAIRGLGGVGVALCILSFLHMLTNVIAANQMQQGLHLVSRILSPRNAVDEESQSQWCQEGTATKHIKLAIALTPSPFFWKEKPGGPREIPPGLHGCWTSNFSLYDALFFANKIQRGYALGARNYFWKQGDTREAEAWNKVYRAASANMYRAGETALRLMDRDPSALRYLLSEYTKDDRFEDGHRVAKQLLACEPRSAEIHLIYGDLLVKEKDYLQAYNHAEAAIRLDREFWQAYAMAGHYAFLYAMERGEQKPETGKLILLACARFNKAVEAGIDLNVEHRYEYTQALFMVKGQENLAIEQGRLLQGTEEFEELCKRIVRFYARVKRMEEGKRVVEALREGMPSRDNAPERP